MRRALCFLLLISIMLLPMAGYAAAKPAAKPGDRLLAAVKGASTGPAELTQFRSANHTDAATGTSKLRLVFDVSAPVEAKGSVVAQPNPRLVVTVKGAVPGKTEGDTDFDGNIADSMSIKSDDGLNTTITIELPMMVDDGEYKVFTLPQDQANNKPFRVVVDINKPLPLMNIKFTPGLKGKVIVLDPGHGGSDPGAVGLSGTTEKAVNLAVALKVKALLDKAGAKVIMTHSDDRDVFGPNATAVEELKARATVANARKADIFVSIHSNAAASRDADGTSTYFYQKTRYDSLLARNLQAGMLQLNSLKDRGTFPANFYVIKRTIMPAALVEMAFLSNPGEERLLSDPQFQQKVAEGIVRGMDNFFAQAAKWGGGGE